MGDTLTSFLNDLTVYQSPDSTNPYLPCTSAKCHAEQRKINVELYLSHFLQRGCPVLLIGEAPGYKGCRVTGIPFTSEYILENNKYFRQHFPQIVCQHKPNQEFGAGKKESSATVVWNTLETAQLMLSPCCWNVFPLHPYNPDKDIWSNRSPTQKEVKKGSEFTLRLIRLLQPDQIIAIGVKAYKQLIQMNVDTKKVRHPANGGGREFQSSLTTLLR